jgi:glutamyl-tRNA synthetase
LSPIADAGAGARVRTRFAPSPTGALHFGSVRTALFAFLAARHAGGDFILRIEDTDQERYIPDTEALILETLSWLGLQWDEGPEIGGPHEPYIQSLRITKYRAYAEQLVASGNAYWCTCTPARLATMRDAQRAKKEPTRYDRRCLGRAEVAEEIAGGMAAVVRLRMPEGVTSWDDLVRGTVSFENAEIDDQVLLKSDGFPTYHLAVVVVDHQMGINHLIRSEEWIPSTPKHLALYAAFGWTPPRFAHVPTVLGPDHQKLSKRRGARNVLEYGELGYLPAAIVNAMALLGWSSGDEEEVFTPEQLCERFSLDRVNAAPAIFDPKRLDDLNGVHIRRMEVEALVEALEFPLIGTSKETRRSLIPMLRERMVTLADATRLCAPLLGDLVPDPSVEFPPKKVDAGTAVAILDACIEMIDRDGIDDPEAADLRKRIHDTAEAAGVKPRDAFRVLYVAILGVPAGLPVIESMVFLGKETSLGRLRAARARLA